MGVYSDRGHIIVEDAGRRVWSTDQAPVNLLPDAYKIVASTSVVFPDFDKNNAYGLLVFTDPITSVSSTACASFSTILPGEWGPGEGGGHYLAPVTLGTVPAGVNFIEVRVNLARTHNPSQILGFDVPKVLPEGVDVLLNGGSAIVELSGDMRRMFEVVLDGQNVVLKRYQSVINRGNYTIWTAGNTQTSGSGGYLSGWTHGGRADGHISYMLDNKVGGGIAKRRGESNACSLTDTTDFSSTWSGTITVTPGRYNS